MQELEKLRTQKEAQATTDKPDNAMCDDDEGSVHYMPAPITYHTPLPVCANGVPAFRNSWHMSLFKLVASTNHKEVTKQIKYAALQNGFRVVCENKEPFNARDGS